MIVQETTTAKCFAKKYLLFFCRINSETICYVQYFFTPWLSMYWRITSTGAPPAVSRQKLWLQKASFLLFLKLDCQWLFFDISLPWSDDNTLDILNAHYDLFFPCKSVLFLTIYVFDWLYYTTDCIVEQVFFFQFISHLQRKENSCYIMLNVFIFLCCLLAIDMFLQIGF